MASTEQGKLLEGKVAVVTGAGRGIGKEIALLMAKHGAKVVVNDLGCTTDGSGAASGPAAEVVKEIKKDGGIAVPNYDDVSKFQGGENIINTALDNFGRIDILVNNAGILRDRMVFNMSEEEWDIVINVVLKGAFNCTKFACTQFRQQNWGRIINMSSGASLGNLGQANYSAAKNGLVGLTRTVARDMGKYNVTCNAIFPGADTRINMSPELQAAIERKAKEGIAVPVDPESRKKGRDPKDIAPVVVYLCTEQAANINGQTLGVTTGKISLYSIPSEICILHKDGSWIVEELTNLMPSTIASGLINPAKIKPSE